MSNRIEICGAIAAGKTTLANAFTQLNYNILLEDFSKISMLDDFYSNPAAFSFETEISFTLQHYYQVKKVLDLNKISVCDFSSVGDYAFALVTLNDKEMQIYDQVFSYIQERLGKPQKLIWLSAPIDTLVSRINKRGRENEQGIDASYLSKFVDSLEKAIKKFYSDVPLININTKIITPVEYSGDFLKGLGL